MVRFLLGTGGWIGIGIGVFFLLLIIIIIAWIIGVYNKLVKMRNQVKNSWAQIDVQLKARFDLIPNLVETVKGYAKHEKDIFEQFAQARKLYDRGVGAGDASQLAAANESLNKIISVVVERYPELKADVHFSKMMNSLEECEKKIAFTRQFYNDVVLKYNNTREVFPAVIIANAFGFKIETYFKVTEQERETPKVTF